MAWIEHPASWPGDVLIEQLTYLDKNGGGHGIGVGWIDAESNRAWVTKGVKLTPTQAVETMLEHTDEALYGFLFHSRVPSVGCECDALCQPFAFELEGQDALIVHNGTWSDWKSAYWMLLGREEFLPPPPFVSDTLVIAKMLEHLGLDYWTLVERGVLVVMSPSGVFLKKSYAGDWAIGKKNGCRLFASRLNPTMDWDEKHEFKQTDFLSLNTPFGEDALAAYIMYSSARSYGYKGGGKYNYKSNTWESSTPKAATKKKKKRHHYTLDERLDQGWLWRCPCGRYATNSRTITACPLCGSKNLRLTAPKEQKSHKHVSASKADSTDLQRKRWQCAEALIADCATTDEVTFSKLSWPNVVHLEFLPNVNLYWLLTDDGHDYIAQIPQRGEYVVLLAHFEDVCEDNAFLYTDEEETWFRQKSWRKPLWVKVSPAGDYDLENEGGWMADVGVISCRNNFLMASTINAYGRVYVLQEGKSTAMRPIKELGTKPKEWDKRSLVYNSSQIPDYDVDNLLWWESTEERDEDTQSNFWACKECSYIIYDGSGLGLPPCPECGGGEWTQYTGPFPNYHVWTAQAPETQAAILNLRQPLVADATKDIYVCNQCNGIVDKPTVCPKCEGVSFKTIAAKEVD